MEGGDVQAIYPKPNCGAYERSAALRAVDTIEPARPRWRLKGGGMSACRNKTSWFLVDLKEKQVKQRGRRREKMVESGN